MTTESGLDEQTTKAMRRCSQEEIDANTFRLQQTYDAMKKYINNKLAHESVAGNQPSPAKVIWCHIPVSPEPTRSSSRVPPTEGVAPPMNVTSGTEIREETIENLQSNRVLARVAPLKKRQHTLTQTDETEFAASESELIYNLREKNISPKFVMNLLNNDEIDLTDEDDDCIIISPPTPTTADEPAPAASNIAKIQEFNEMNRSVIKALYTSILIQTKNQLEKADKDKLETSTASTKQDEEDFKSRVINIVQELAADGNIDSKKIKAMKKKHLAPPDERPQAAVVPHKEIEEHFNSRVTNIVLELAANGVLDGKKSKATKKKRLAPPDKTPQAAVVPHKEKIISMREARIPNHASQLTHVPCQMQMFLQHEPNNANYPQQGYRGMNEHFPRPPPPPPMSPILYPPLPMSCTRTSTVTPTHPIQHINPATTELSQYRHMEYHGVPEFERHHTTREYLGATEFENQIVGYPNSQWSHS